MHPDHPWGRYISYGDCVRLQFAEKPTGSENNLYDKALNHINFMVSLVSYIQFYHIVCT